MPLGSSSDAPVIRPGPRISRRRNCGFLNAFLEAGWSAVAAAAGSRLAMVEGTNGLLLFQLRRNDKQLRPTDERRLAAKADIPYVSLLPDERSGDLRV